jgi:hypothetical protein
MSATFNINFDLLPLEVRDQLGKALFAASTAASISAEVESGMWAYTFPVAGLRVSMYWLSAGGTNWPPVFSFRIAAMNWD